MEMISKSERFLRVTKPARDALVVVCVCTYRRPKSLQRCLESLARQQRVENATYQFLVVDNDEKCSAMAVLRNARVNAFYVAEPRRGIAFARNKAIEVARQLRADWIAFLDDDEIADDQWLKQLMSPDYRTVPILRGRRILRLPDPAPFWAMPVEEKMIEEGTGCHTAYTHNVRFSSAVTDSGLRFDEALAFSGGEDVDFFTRARKLGFEIRHTERAITYETVHIARLTYRRQCKTSSWIAAANVRESITRKGLARTLCSKLHTIPLNLVLGPMLLLASPIALLTGIRAFKKTALAGGDKIARAIGRAAAIVGYLPAPYFRTDGE